MSMLTFTLHTPEDLVRCQQLPHAHCPHYATFMILMKETKCRLGNTRDINQKTTRQKPRRRTQVAWHHSSLPWQLTTLGSLASLSPSVLPPEKPAMSFVSTPSAHPSQCIYSYKKTYICFNGYGESRQETGIMSINSTLRLKVQIKRDDADVLFFSVHPSQWCRRVGRNEADKSKTRHFFYPPYLECK